MPHDIVHMQSSRAVFGMVWFFMCTFSRKERKHAFRISVSIVFSVESEMIRSHLTFVRLGSLLMFVHTADRPCRRDLDLTKGGLHHGCTMCRYGYGLRLSLGNTIQ